MPYFPFESDAARAAAIYFTKREGGRINKMKLVKLMYIVERTALQEAETALFGGRYFSLPYGPIISEVGDALDGETWSGLQKSGSHDVALTPGVEVPNEFLSVWSGEMLERVYREYGHMDQWQISEYTHAHFKEWKQPQGAIKRVPITLSDILPEPNPELESLAAELTFLDSLS